MASIFFRRLAEKYSSTKLKGKKYQAVIREILLHNSQKMGRAVARLSDSSYKEDVKRLSKTRRGTVKLPTMDSVLPKRSVFLVKAAESGKMISTTLRDDLTKDLRETLKEFDGTGKNRMEFQRGKATGKINPELVKAFQRRIRKTFESRTKRDPKLGVPPNVKNIAVTEIRSAVGEIKARYKDELLKKNPNLVMTKTWLHNRGLSKNPRLEHMRMHGVTIEVSELFNVDNAQGGSDFMDRPHDPKAPADQVIGCSCDVVYKAQFKD